MNLLDYWETDTNMKQLFCGLSVPQPQSKDFGRGTAVKMWLESLGLSEGCAGHRSGNGVQWPERMVTCIGKLPSGTSCFA